VKGKGRNNRKQRAMIRANLFAMGVRCRRESLRFPPGFRLWQLRSIERGWFAADLGIRCERARNEIAARRVSPPPRVWVDGVELE